MRTQTTLFHRAVLTVALALLAPACASVGQPPAAVVPESAGASGQSAGPAAPVAASGAPAIVAPGGPVGASGASGVLGANPVPGPATFDADNIESFAIKSLDRLVIRLANADVVLESGGGGAGVLKVDKIEGDPDCKVHVVQSPGSLEVADLTSDQMAARVAAAANNGSSKGRSMVPTVPSCRYIVSVRLREAADAVVELVRGSLAADQWPEPITARVEWGDIDVGSVGALSVRCGHCSLAGDGVEGPVKYAMEWGNVGVAGLAGSVEGQTLGDIILKWKRVKPDSSVKLSSRAGDVMLFFPDTIPLSVDLHAPRGDVNSKVDPGQSGMPVAVTAEVGNVALYRMSDLSGGGGGRSRRLSKRH